MRPARRPASVPFLATTVCGLRGITRPPGRRIGRASSSSSAARVPGRSRSVSVGVAGVAAGVGAGRAAPRLLGAARRRVRRPGAVAGRPRPPCGPPPRLPAARRLLGRAGALPLPRPCGPLPRAGAPPRRPTGSKSSPARAARPRACAASRCCSTSARCRAACSVAVRARGTAVGAGRSAGAAPARAVGAGGGRRAALPPRRARRADRGALLAHLDLHHLGAAVAEALPHGAGVDRAAELQAARGPQREPALAGILIVGFAHRLPVGPVRICSLNVSGLAAGAVSPQSPQPRRLDGEPLAQSSGRDRDMHHMVTTEHPAKRRRRKRSQRP